MNYEEKYKDALKIAKEVYHDHRKDKYWQNWLTELFPELKENDSEDERIRKAIIAYISHGQHCGVSNADMIAWLEKQGEKMTKPKFNVGDWITDGRLTCKVLGVTGKSYELHLHNDDYCHFETDIQSVDKYYHLWTIKDAKDGDVLVHNDCPFIFMGIKDNLVQALEENLCDSTNPVNFGEPNIDNDYQPATREQRKLLFQKIKEAGYEWDSEKKELKKIEVASKESKDERIRKAIHIYLDWLDGRKDYEPKGVYSIKDMIAWLEKQTNKD